VTLNFRNEPGVTVYEIERSVDGQAFVKVGEVPKNDMQKYRFLFVDSDVLITNPGKCYEYRIRLLIKDGPALYSNKEKLTIADPANITLSSTMFTDRLVVRANSRLPRKLLFRLVDFPERLSIYMNDIF
jgi:hypothetical protein